jgi:hypothetical protein
MSMTELCVKAKIEEAGRKAIEFRRKGFHCSESTFLAINETLNITHPAMVRIVTGFHGGGGSRRKKPEVDLVAALEEVASGKDQRPREELPFEQIGHLCGALASGIVSIGFLHGRRTPADDLTCVDELCFELHRRFREKFGENECRALRANYVPLTPGKTCEPIYRGGAELAVELILEAQKLVPECAQTRKEEATVGTTDSAG